MLILIDVLPSFASFGLRYVERTLSTYPLYRGRGVLRSHVNCQKLVAHRCKHSCTHACTNAQIIVHTLVDLLCYIRIVLCINAHLIRRHRAEYNKRVTPKHEKHQKLSPGQYELHTRSKHTTNRKRPPERGKGILGGGAGGAP